MGRWGMHIVSGTTLSSLWFGIWSLALQCRALVLVMTVATPVLADDLSIAAPLRYEMTPNASGFFVSLDGTILTARHVVNGCQSLYTLKDGRVTRAELLAVSDTADLALVRSAIKPYLAAVFAADDRVRASQPVFTAGYDALAHTKDHGTLMYNGFSLNRQTRPDQVEMALFSGAEHGASGSPVLDSNGLVIGLVAKREMTGGLSGQSAVIAVSNVAIKEFLRHAGIVFHDSDQPQLSPLQARAPRAATLMVGVICG